MSKRIIQFAIAALSLLVMTEALFWPVIMKHGTTLDWWQNYYLAQIGKYLGFPVWMVLFKSPFEGNFNLAFAWLLVISWAAFLYWLAGVAIDFFIKFRN